MPITRDAKPYWTLTGAFVAWKAFLLAIVAGSCAGPTYDTSSSLLLQPDTNTSNQAAALIPTLVTRLTSWDAIYFVESAQRGYLFEQEWAFGTGLPTSISVLVRGLQSLGLVDITSQQQNSYNEPLVGIIIAHVSHLLSVLILYELGARIWQDRKWALAAALLHVLSPAGLFLSAPYAESPFSLLSFTGYLLLVRSCYATGATWRRDALTLLAGVVFGVATAFRTNGLLNGIPLAVDFLVAIYDLVEGDDHAFAGIRRLLVLGISGLCVAAGSVIPQVLAYQTYCSDASGSIRPWCTRLVPSIYNYVQKQYWNTGFLNYWTLSNAPLFLLAAPMLFVLGKSGKDVFFQSFRLPSKHRAKATGVDGGRLAVVVGSMAAAQMLLVLMAVTTYHVQIVTRLSSAYPAWYWWLAACLKSSKTRGMGSGIVVFMIMYASIQGTLFASFLPPA